MNRKAKKVIVIAATVALTVILLTSVYNKFVTNWAEAQDLPSETIPRAIYPCLPGARAGLPEPRMGRSPFLRGAVNYEGKQYYVVEMLYKTIPPFEDYEEDFYQGGRFFVLLEQVGCLALNTTDNATDLLFQSLTEVVPEPVAQQMALQWWQKRLQEFGGSTEKLREDILDGLKPGPDTLYLFEEDVWALNQLGIIIPESALNQPR